MIYKPLHRQLKIEQREPHYKPEVNLGTAVHESIRKAVSYPCREWSLR